MERIIILFLLLVILSILLGFLLSQLSFTTRTQKAGFFSTETRAVCEEIKLPDCYYRCHDELFLILGRKEISIQKSKEYVCHEKDWKDPRAIYKH